MAEAVQVFNYVKNKPIVIKPKSTNFGLGISIFKHGTSSLDDYSNAINDLLSNYTIDKIYYGIGLPTIKHSKKSEDTAQLVDFIIGVEENKQISILYNPKIILF